MNPSNSEVPINNQAPLSRRLTRRRFLATGISTAAGAALGVTGYHGFREARQLSFKQVMISVRQLPYEFEGCAIAHLSDFHYHPIFTAEAIREAVYLVNRLNPYIVVLTGDFVTVASRSLRRKSKPAIRAQAEPCAELLSQLRPKRGIFAVLGNHDHYQPDVVMDSLQSRGIQVLRNEAVPLQKGGNRLWIAGVDDVLADAADLDMALRNIPSHEPTILLAHEPDFADDVAESPVDVQLSGHSHGGQIRLPLIGPPYLPELARKYPWGLRRVGELNLYTNCGLGTIEVPVRWNCPPEVTLIRLVRRSV
jgi:uncharacterized protein